MNSNLTLTLAEERTADLRRIAERSRLAAAARQQTPRRSLRARAVPAFVHRRLTRWAARTAEPATGRPLVPGARRTPTGC
jgi:hypothetical protein